MENSSQPIYSRTPIYLRNCTSHRVQEIILLRAMEEWYLYHSLLFLAPHVAYRRTSNNFMRENTIITPSSPSTSQSAQSVQLVSQPTSDSLFSDVWTPTLFSDDSNVSTSLSERSTSSESLATSVSSIRQPRSSIAKKNVLSSLLDQSKWV